MSSYEDRMRAIAPYIKLGKRARHSILPGCRRQIPVWWGSDLAIGNPIAPDVHHWAACIAMMPIAFGAHHFLSRRACDEGPQSGSYSSRCKFKIAYAGTMIKGSPSEGTTYRREIDFNEFRAGM